MVESPEMNFDEFVQKTINWFVLFGATGIKTEGPVNWECNFTVSYTCKNGTRIEVAGEQFDEDYRRYLAEHSWMSDVVATA